ncbi:MAG: hypothetical protein IJJ69_07645, partial [Oscillospiraceae bacterium]|nr:hypothetical protein [Oscillospiraceae bacterium]
IKYAGIVATNNAEKAENLTAENADFKRGQENPEVHSYKYTWTKSSVQADETWYVKGYLVYTDANGNEKTVYSDMAKATLDGYEIIKEEKILGTAMIDSVSVVETNKLRFVSLTNVPADCTIQFAGIVATDNTEDAANLTTENARFIRGGENLTVHNYKYTWTKKDVTADQIWYVRAYLKYTDNSGKAYTVYGDLRTATLS